METHPNNSSPKRLNQSQNLTQSQSGSNTEPKKSPFSGVGINKQNIFTLPPNIESDPTNQAQTDPKTSQIVPIQPQKPLMSRETYNKLTLKREEANKKKVKHARQKPDNLSQIQELSCEYHSSSEESGFVSDSSLDESGSQNWSVDENIDVDRIDFSQTEENLDKTVLMSKKKGPRQPIPAQKIEPKQNQKGIMLAKLLQEIPFQKIYELYKQGTISQKHYEKMLQMKKEKSQTEKMNKFTSNLQKIQQKANIIIGKFEQLHLKLSKDTYLTELKYKELVQIFNSIQRKNEKIGNQFDPEKMRFEIKLLEKWSEVKAKKELLKNLQNCLEELRNKYKEHLVRLDEQKKQKQNFSQNLIFQEIKDFLKLGNKLYNSILCSLIKNSETGISAIKKKAKELYIQKLQEKYAPELKQVESVILEKIIEYHQSVDNCMDKIQTQDKEVIEKIISKFSKQVNKSLDQTVDLLHQKSAWITIVKENGQLQCGNIYHQAIEIVKLDPPTELNLLEFSQKVIVENFKFYIKKIVKKIQVRFQPLKSMYYLLRTNKEKKHMKNQKEKLDRLKQQIAICQRETYSLDVASNRVKNSEKRIGKIMTHLDQKIKSVSTLKERISKLVEEEDTKKAYKSLIPNKKVAIFNFTTTNEEPSDSKQNKLEKPSWKQLFSQIQKKKLEVPDSHMHISSSKRENIQSYSNLSCDPNMERSQQKFSKDMEKILMNSHIDQTNEETKKNHIDKVCDLILRKQVVSQEYEKNEIFQPQNESIFQTIFDSVQLTGWKPLISEPSLNFDVNPERSFTYKSVSKRILPSSKPQSDPSWLIKSQSRQDIQAACQLFIRQFYKNPHILEQLALDNHQLSFLISPEYRQQFMEKKLKDHQLAEKLLQIIRLNTQPIQKDQNPIKYMMHVDPDFQQKIQEYQQKIVKNQKHVDSNQPKPYYDLDDMSTNADTEVYEMLDHKIKELQDDRRWDSHLHRHSEYMRRDSDYSYWDEQ